MFRAEIDIDITSSGDESVIPTIGNLAVSGLSPWARAELNEWTGKLCRSQDAGQLLYGLGNYWEIAARRAECWSKCQEAFSHLFTKSPFDDKENHNQVVDKSRPELLRNLGRTSIALQDDEVLLRITWTITFDWTGEVESKVRASASFARICELRFITIICSIEADVLLQTTIMTSEAR